ncbi:hypothetical protein SDC9_167400 [bioreactor metagenome]|uniref:Uncharacterized protein n=1 Tax=bioreactor metagenome TaxID=1076179 RepID=A0A645G7D5_9ZZZZ
MVRIQHGFAPRVLVAVGGQRRHLGDQPFGGLLDRLRGVGDRVETVGGQHHQAAGQHRHRVRAAREHLEELPHPFVHHGLAADPVFPGGQLGGGRQLAIDHQIGGLQEGRLLGQLLDRIPAVAQDSGVPVDIGDGRHRRSGVRQPIVIGRIACFRQQLADVDTRRTLGRHHDRCLEIGFQAADTHGIAHLRLFLPLAIRQRCVGPSTLLRGR